MSYSTRGRRPTNVPVTDRRSVRPAHHSQDHQVHSPDQEIFNQGGRKFVLKNRAPVPLPLDQDPDYEEVEEVVESPQSHYRTQTYHNNGNGSFNGPQGGPPKGQRGQRGVGNYRGNNRGGNTYNNSNNYNGSNGSTGGYQGHNNGRKNFRGNNKSHGNSYGGGDTERHQNTNNPFGDNGSNGVKYVGRFRHNNRKNKVIEFTYDIHTSDIAYVRWAIRTELDKILPKYKKIETLVITIRSIVFSRFGEFPHKNVELAQREIIDYLKGKKDLIEGRELNYYRRDDEKSNGIKPDAEVPGDDYSEFIRMQKNQTPEDFDDDDSLDNSSQHSYGEDDSSDKEGENIDNSTEVVLPEPDAEETD